MQIVIDIPEKCYNDIRNSKTASNYSVLSVLDGTRNGPPLPKGHGRLIDADEFLKENKDYTGWVLCSDAWGGENAYKDTLEDLITEAPTIIEADKAESEGKE